MSTNNNGSPNSHWVEGTYQRDIIRSSKLVGVTIQFEYCPVQTQVYWDEEHKLTG